MKFRFGDGPIHSELVSAEMPADRQSVSLTYKVDRAAGLTRISSSNNQSELLVHTCEPNGLLDINSIASEKVRLKNDLLLSKDFGALAILQLSYSFDLDPNVNDGDLDFETIVDAVRARAPNLCGFALHVMSEAANFLVYFPLKRADKELSVSDFLGSEERSHFWSPLIGWILLIFGTATILFPLLGISDRLKIRDTSGNLRWKRISARMCASVAISALGWLFILLAVAYDVTFNS